MNRVMVYPGAIPLETDLLNAQKNDMIGLAKLSAAVFGTSTQVNGLACTPNSPAALNVIVAPGEIYSLQNIDGTAYSSLAADTAHQIVKQGIMLDQVILSTPAPVTAGNSINYLIQATYSEVDGTAVVLPYYNATNPATAYSGPANAGTTNNTVRAGVCTVSAKAGISAVTGSQITPAPDAGNVGLWVVTVAQGQATVTAPNIVQVVGAPFVNTTLQATETVQGTAKVATQAVTNTGTDDATFITPKKLRWGFAAVFALNGYITFPTWLGSWIVQWGAASTSGSAAVAVTFPITFPTAAYAISFGASSTGTGVFVTYNSIAVGGFNLEGWSATATRFAAQVSYITVGK